MAGCFTVNIFLCDYHLEQTYYNINNKKKAEKEEKFISELQYFKIWLENGNYFEIKFSFSFFVY